MAAQQLAISTTAGNGGKFTVVAPRDKKPNNNDHVIVDKEAFK
tara:strand:- start:93 stop:221 length:129 start_codon:yes stop_codon:yes gene_type:complete